MGLGDDAPACPCGGPEPAFHASFHASPAQPTRLAVCVAPSSSTTRRAGLLQVGALLLLNHPDRVDERRRENRRGRRRTEPRLAALVTGDHTVPEQDAELWDALEEHADEPGPEAGQRGG